MRIIRSDHFDTMSNSALNRAIAMADAYNCGEVNCSHLMAAILTSSEEVADKFKNDTGLTVNDYMEALEHQCSAGYYGRKSDLSSDPKFELSLENTSKSFEVFLNAILVIAKKEKSLVTLDKMYTNLLSDKKNEVYETLSALGVQPDEIVTKEEANPLSKMPITARYGSDMCLMAAKGMFDPVESRDQVIDDVIEILGRRQKGNPCLIGEPGVGKTAVVEGLAQRIVSGNVPNFMKKKHIINIDVSGIVSGAKFRGEFEERFNSILYEAAANPNIILFFDEFHMLIGAGSSGNEGNMDAANILKPAISRGDIRIIGATTTKEFNKFIEKDGAFSRRVQSVMVDEPVTSVAIKMIEKLAPVYETYHKCRLSKEVIAAAVKMSDRYITDKKLPDKAISVIDETAARLKAYAPENVVIDITIDDIRSTISKNTGIDVNDIDNTSKDKLQALEGNLKKHVIGQDHAVESVVKAIRRAKAGIKDPNRPIGSFLFVGPTGVGKTELTKAVATEFSGSIKHLIKFDMSEFMEKHTVARLIGAPPGYVGYGEGGQLTEAVRHNPNSVILFDEIEKAHKDVFNIMLQILDDGVLTDAQGNHIDFKNSVIIMTSNAGYGKEEGSVAPIGFSNTKSVEDADATEAKAIKALESTFRPEFLNRLDKIVVFNSLSKEDCSNIIELELNKVSKRLSDKNISITWDSSLIDFILDVGFSDKYGARNLKRKVQEHVEDKLADLIIDQVISPLDDVHISYDNGVIFKDSCGNMLTTEVLSMITA